MLTNIGKIIHNLKGSGQASRVWGTSRITAFVASPGGTYGIMWREASLSFYANKQIGNAQSQAPAADFRKTGGFHKSHEPIG
jgi:hypothetical protein